ncbi:trk system potassium uptake protein TrkA [Arthrobacter sp. UYP6]|uniref:potassium channel family protein n=1 Tax=Arthrobacter sp. UYP6 TaxID=1756378 RepID=UPI003395D235
MARFSFLPRVPAHFAQAGAVAVLGLGRFGEAVALELMAEDVEVLGVDQNGAVVQRLDGELTYVVSADATDAEVLKQLSVPEFDRAVVGITEDIAASILVASQLIGFGVTQVWAAAVSSQHGLILDQIGVHHVVYPEQDMGTRVAHLVRGGQPKFTRVGDNYAVAETVPPAALVGVPLDPLEIQVRYGISVIGKRKAGRAWEFTGTGTVLSSADRILVAGTPEKTGAFGQLSARG